MRWEKNATLCSPPPPSVYLSVFILYLCSSCLSLSVLSFLCWLLQNCSLVQIFFSLCCCLSIYLFLSPFCTYFHYILSFLSLLFLSVLSLFPSLYFFMHAPTLSPFNMFFSPEIIEFSKLRWQRHFYAHIFFQLISC